MIKSICENPTANIMSNGECLNTFPLQMKEKKQWYPLSALLFNTELELWASAMREEKEKGRREERNGRRERERGRQAGR